MSTTMTADKVVGKVLIAKRNNNVYDSPGGSVIGVINNGSATAPIYSYLQGNDGSVWWMFDYTIPGQMPGAYYVKHSATDWKIGAMGESNIEVNTSLFGGNDDDPGILETFSNKIVWILSAFLALTLILKSK